MRLICCLLLLPISLVAQDGFIDGEPRLAFWKIGNNDVTVVVLHGGPAAHHKYLRPEFDALSKTASVIYYDQRGCGKSGLADSYVWRDHVEDLRRLIHGASCGKVFLIGSSWGSSLALLYTLYYPEDVIGVILSGTYPWQGREAYYERRSSAYTNNEGVSSYCIVESNREARQSTRGGVINETYKVSRVVEIENGLPAIETQNSCISAPKLVRFNSILQPVLIFKGNQEGCRIDRAEDYFNVLSNSELFSIEGVCHDPWLGSPKIFFDRCIAFIVRHSPNR